jgi:hypothetical protein
MAGRTNVITHTATCTADRVQCCSHALSATRVRNGEAEFKLSPPTLTICSNYVTTPALDESRTFCDRSAIGLKEAGDSASKNR